MQMKEGKKTRGEVRGKEEQKRKSAEKKTNS